MAYRIRVIPKEKASHHTTRHHQENSDDLQVIESLTRPLVEERAFPDLSAPVLVAFDAISLFASYPKQATLFVEGQEGQRCVRPLQRPCKLSANSADGKSIIVRFAEPGELVGLPGTLLGEVYELTAQALEPVQAKFIPRGAFVQFLRKHGEAALRVAEILSDIYKSTLLEVRNLGFRVLRRKSWRASCSICRRRGTKTTANTEPLLL